MNLMILSPGRRVEVVQYFKKTFGKNGGKILTLDMSPYAPALYEGDAHFVVEKDFNDLETYMDQVLEICKEQKVEAIITLIDPELALLAENSERFIKEGITPIVSKREIVNVCFDKYLFYKTLAEEVSVVKTYWGYEEIKEALEREEVAFPLFAKIRCGSGSVGIGKIEQLEQLEAYKNKENYIFQPFIKNKEYGVDVYFDMLDGKIKSIFMKEKLAMRAGETDKAVSVYREDIKELVMQLEKFKFRGPIDIDIFEDVEGKLYINEINPRFGGGYTHAYNCGANFIESIYSNLERKVVDANIGDYKRNIIMLKHNDAKYLDYTDFTSLT